jgi:hypothetical protein
MEVDVKSTAAPPSSGVMPATGREHLGTVLFGLWMTAGLFLDGYFHQNLETDGESFLTPWHAVFYAGFTGSALWLAAMSRRRATGRVVDWRLSFLPDGYAGARVGLLLFAVGGLGDAAWHRAFGVERGIDALLSPTHLLLFAGLVLILTAPLQAARAAPESAPGPWMIAGSVIAATALVGFFLNFAWGLGIAALTRVAYDPVTGAGETAVIAGVASTLVTTVVLFGAARVLLVAAPPVGAVALLFGAVALLVSAAFDEDVEGVAAAVVAGVTLDVVTRVRAGGRSSLPLPTCFAVTATVLWLAYLGVLSALDGIEWQGEIWLGTVTLNALAAFAIATVRPASPSLTPTPEGAAPGPTTPPRSSADATQSSPRRPPRAPRAAHPRSRRSSALPATGPATSARCPPRRWTRRWAAGTPPPSPTWPRATSCSTSAPAAASTSSCRLAAPGPRAWRTGST